MTASANPARRPFRHAAAIYDSDEEFLAAVVPFIAEGVAADEPVIVALNPAQQELLTSAVGQPSGVSVVVPGDHYRHPLSALRTNQALFHGYLRAGADRVRVVGDLPHGDPATWPGWARYEALCNHHFADLPVSALCTYDTRDTSAEILADVLRLHTELADPEGQHLSNPEYVAPETFLRERAQADADPLEAGEPQVVLVNPPLESGRRAVAEMAVASGVAADELVIVVNEALANAQVHGRPPVRLQAWSRPGHVVVTVTDAGPGPSDPFVGLLPPDPDSIHGRGLWISHHLCDALTISAGDNGCVVRIVEANASRPT